MTGTPRPEDGERYLWWQQGVRDEAAARNEGMSPQAIGVRETLEALAQPRVVQAGRDADLVAQLARIYCPGMLKRKYRK